MNKSILLVFALALASQVFSAPQSTVSVEVNLGGNKVADVNVKAAPEETTAAATTLVAAVVPEVPSVFDSSPPLGPTTAKPLPERVRESIQAAIQGAGQAIRVVPATITNALQNFANGVRQALRPRQTTPIPPLAASTF